MEAITENGGEVLLETAARRILLKKEKIVGVEDGDGTIHPAKAVIANSNVPELFSDLIVPEEVPGKYLKKLSHYQPSLSSFIVWLGLNRELKDIKDY